MVILGRLIIVSFRLDLSIGRVWWFMGMGFLGFPWRFDRGSQDEGDWLLHNMGFFRMRRICDARSVHMCCFQQCVYLTEFLSVCGVG